MKINHDKWSLWERKLPAIIGVLELVIGLILVSIALFTPFTVSISPKLVEVLSDLGIGLFAAGIVTATLEPISRKRLQRDVEEIKQAHLESILKGFMPEPIFKEVQSQIIGQPFLRMNFHMNIEFSWTDEKKEYLHNSQISVYDIENISRAVAVYELRTSVEQMNEDKFPGCSSIQEIRVQPFWGIRVKLSGLNLSQHSQRIYSFVTFAFEALSHDKRRGVL